MSIGRNTAVRPVRVGLVIDGTEAYGVENSMQLLLENLDRSRVTIVGLFLGDTALSARFARLCDEACWLHTGCFFPIGGFGRRRFGLDNMANKFNIALRAAWKLSHEIRRRKIDLIHVNFYPLHFVAGLASRWAGVPCLWHWRGVTNRGRVAQLISHFGMRCLADRIPCISAFVRESVPPAMRGKACVVYNGVPAHQIAAQQKPGALRARLGLAPDVPLVAIFGSLTQYKGHEFFIEAAGRVHATHPSVRFAIVGDETEVQRVRLGRDKKLHALVADQRLSDVVFFTGHLPQARLYMRDCDVICMPTIPLRIGGEGFGLSMAEAMAAGVATIATNCGAPPEVIEDGVSGLLVPPRDSAALSAAIIRLLTDDALRTRVAAAGQARIRAHFDSSNVARAMEAVYRECARR